MLDQAKVKTGDTVQTFTKITTGKYNLHGLALHPSGGTNGSVADEDPTVAEIRTSVGTYGGFYIAKYEAGIANTEGVAKDNFSLTIKTATDRSIKPLSQAEKGVWNFITRADCLTVSKAMIDSIETGCKSTLISGECWDTTLAWITATSDSNYAENSAEKGWYSDVSSKQLHTTGYYGTNTNNIYDMGGNVIEFTSENCLYDDGEDVAQCVVFRGGYYESLGSAEPPSYRDGDGGGAISNYGFRVVLYK